jgi:hypothetical protein
MLSIIQHFLEGVTGFIWYSKCFIITVDSRKKYHDKKFTTSNQILYRTVIMKLLQYLHANETSKKKCFMNKEEHTALCIKMCTLQLADSSENFREMHMKIYQIDPDSYDAAVGYCGMCFR